MLSSLTRLQASFPSLLISTLPATGSATTFLLHLPVPHISPSTTNFASGLACICYEVRVAIGLVWKGENKLVTDKPTSMLSRSLMSP